MAKMTEQKVQADSKLDAIFESLKGKTEPIRIEMEEKQKELIPLRKVVNEFQQNVSVCEAELKIFEDKTGKAAAQYDEVKSQLDSFDGKAELKQREYRDLQETLSKREARLHDAKNDLVEVTTQQEECEQERRELRNKVAECQEGLASNSSRSKLLDGLMREKKRGRLAGLHGRLGELGTIDAKYDVAITTAVPALNNLVVDDTLTGAKCIEHLRQQKLGRATFLILEKIQHLKARSEAPCNPPEGVPRLFDLVKPRDSRYNVAFYSAMGDTLVAKDMDQAIRIAYSKTKRWRVVTLDGKLIDTSGTMSGGGNKVARGGMSSKQISDNEYTEKDAAQFAKQLQECEATLDSLRQKKKGLELEIRQLAGQISKDKVVLQKLKLVIDSQDTQKAQLQVRLKELQGSLKLTAGEEKRVASLKSEIETQSKELQQAKKGAQKLESQIESLQRKIMDAGGSELRIQKSKAESFGKMVDDISKEMTKFKVDLSSGANKLAKLEKDLSEASKNADDAASREEQLKEEHKSMEADALQVLSAYKDAQKVQETTEKELEVISKEYSNLKKVVESIRGVEVDICDRMEDYDRVISDNFNKGKHWGKKLVTLQEKIRAAEALIRNVSSRSHSLRSLQLFFTIRQT